MILVSAFTSRHSIETETWPRQVRGIGRWTADMFAMFHLGRPDVLPVGDLGVRKGFQILYGLKVSIFSTHAAAPVAYALSAWGPLLLAMALDGTHAFELSSPAADF